MLMQRPASYRTVSSTIRKVTSDAQIDEARAAALCAGQVGAHELAEQRRRMVGPALELGMGLGADPERMTVELDELDQPLVGRHAGAHEPGALELAAVLG